jgi:nitrate/nitrite-specific signal transduction histidine kinase
VSDDGIGFDGRLAESSGGVGLTSMRERAAHLRAELQIASAPGAGTRITVLVPARTLAGNGAGALAEASAARPAREV